MNQEIRDLQPQVLWNKFADLNAIPRASKKEEQVISFMKGFGKNLGLETIVDKVGNVIIRKPATPGMEQRKPVVLQSHLDMVHQKNNSTNFDFNTQGIDMFVEGDWVKARGTTLGADNGLGVAAIMAILESREIAHPELEALFTIDEETGMTGAMGLEPGVLHGEILLNLDTEEDDEIGIGCAGGVDVTAQAQYQQEQVPENCLGFKITVNGLRGGHSGMDIIKGLGNANQLMNRILYQGHMNLGLRISRINGGGLRNAIPRESEALVVIPELHRNGMRQELDPLINAIKKEYQGLEPELEIKISEVGLPETIMEISAQEALVKSIYATHNGVYRMSPEIEGLVESSNNIARVTVQDGKIQVLCLTRSSVESSKVDLANSIRSGFELGDFEVELSGEYPGWAPNPDSAILEVLDKLYQKMNGEKADIAACHAGLECGILGQHYPEMDMISFGPTIRGAHSPDERASISSTQKFWTFLLEVLQNVPKRR